MKVSVMYGLWYHTFHQVLFNMPKKWGCNIFFANINRIALKTSLYTEINIIAAPKSCVNSLPARNEATLFHLRPYFICALKKCLASPLVAPIKGKNVHNQEFQVYVVSQNCHNRYQKELYQHVNSCANIAYSYVNMWIIQKTNGGQIY